MRFRIKALWYKQRAATYRRIAEEHRRLISWHLQATSHYEDKATEADKLARAKHAWRPIILTERR